MLPRGNMIRAENADCPTFSTNDFITSSLYLHGSWATSLHQIAHVFCAAAEEPFAIDIGANLGAFAVPLAQSIADAGGTVFAYEAQRIVFYQLCANAFLNRLDNLHPFHLALGVTDGTLAIPDVDYGHSANIGGFSLAEAGSRRDNVAELNSQTEISLKRLDSLSLPKPPCLLKIDVEGAELDVLMGAERTLRDAGYPPLMLEAWTSEWFREKRALLLSYLASIGYDSFLFGDEIIAQHRDHPRQFHFVQNANGSLNMARLR